MLVLRSLVGAAAIAFAGGVARADTRDETESASSSIVVVVRFNGREVSDVHVTIDGVRVRDKLDGRAITVAPGSHHVRIDNADGSLLDEEDVVIKKGEQSHAIELVRDDSVVRVVPRPHTMGPWIFVGAGAVVVVVGVTVLVLAQEQQSPSTTSTMSIVGPTLMGIGGAAILAGLLWHFAEPTSTRVARIVPMVTPTFAGATFRMTF